MSLIFEALKKLEREKARQASPIVTAGEAPWAPPSSRVPGWMLIGAAVALLVLGVGLGSWLRVRPATETIPRGEAADALEAPPAGLREAPAHSTALPPPPAAPRPVRPDARRETRSVAAPPRPRPAAATTPPSAATTPRSVAKAPAAEPIETRPDPAAVGGTSGEPRLQAISERNGKSIALINDRVLFEGETAGDVRVIRIGPSEVEVEWKGRRRTLTF